MLAQISGQLGSSFADLMGAMYELLQPFEISVELFICIFLPDESRLRMDLMR